MFRRSKYYIYLTAIFSFLCMSGSAYCADVALTESISGGLRYSNNARLQPEGELADEDFIMTLSPHLGLVNDRGWILLRGSYGLSAFYYLKNPELSTLAHSADVGMNMPFSQNTNFSLTDRVNYSKENIEGSTTGIQRTRTTNISNLVTAGLDHAFTTKTNGFISLSDIIFRHEGATVTTTRTDSGTVGIGFAATDRTSLSTSYGLTNIRYDTSSGVTNFIIHSLQAGFEYQVSPSIQLHLSGGAVYTPSINNSKTDWIANISATKTFDRAILIGGYSRVVTDTSGLISQVNVSETYSLQARYDLTESSNIALNGSYSQNKTKPFSDLEMSSYSVGITGSWNPYAWMTVSTGYQHFDQVSSGTVGMDLRRDNIFINIAATRSRRF